MHVLKHGDIVAVGRLEFRVVARRRPVTESPTDDTVASADDLDTMMEGLEVTSAADRPTPPPASFDTGETLTDMPLVVGDETRIASQGTPTPGETGFYYPGQPQMPMPGMPTARCLTVIPDIRCRRWAGSILGWATAAADVSAVSAAALSWSADAATAASA